MSVQYRAQTKLPTGVNIRRARARARAFILLDELRQGSITLLNHNEGPHYLEVLDFGTSFSSRFFAFEVGCRNSNQKCKVFGCPTEKSNRY